MKNPWLTISHLDYENHMRAVGQSQVLNRLTKYCPDKYLPENFALLGCSTGNGLEHIKPQITKTVYAIDINQEYLDETKKRYGNKIKNLKLYNADLQNDKLTIKSIDLFFIGLVLEYVNPKKVLKKVIKMIGKKGVLFIVIQKDEGDPFVSKTKYELIKREKIELTKNKFFITLEYQMKE